MTSKNNGAAPRNRTITLTEKERARYKKRLLALSKPVSLDFVLDRTISQDLFQVLRYLPDASVDLLFADPPYNLTRTFNLRTFQRTSLDDYEKWLDSWLALTVRLLKPTASIYICGDWRSSAAIHRVGVRHFQAQNRITWEREKGRGAKSNWKNCSEDIWFFTKSNIHTFNLNAVKLNREVKAPYTDREGQPKDWNESEAGRLRLTHPSNIWTDITVPFWSMPENTGHPTQKPEKLLAKIVLASSNEGDVILDPFLGSGTTSVVARKLKRRFIGVEVDEYFCCLAEKRLEMAAADDHIQGYADGVFWDRNSLSYRSKKRAGKSPSAGQSSSR